MDLAYTRFDIRVSTISNLHVFMELIINELIFNPDILLFIYKYVQIIFFLETTLLLVTHVQYPAHSITTTTGFAGTSGVVGTAGIAGTAGDALPAAEDEDNGAPGFSLHTFFFPHYRLYLSESMYTISLGISCLCRSR